MRLSGIDKNVSRLDVDIDTFGCVRLAPERNDDASSSKAPSTSAGLHSLPLRPAAAPATRHQSAAPRSTLCNCPASNVLLGGRASTPRRSAAQQLGSLTQWLPRLLDAEGFLLSRIWNDSAVPASCRRTAGIRRNGTVRREPKERLRQGFGFDGSTLELGGHAARPVLLEGFDFDSRLLEGVRHCGVVVWEERRSSAAAAPADAAQIAQMP